jgi:glycosidase
MPGASHTPFAVLTHTMPRSLPLIYGGQEEPILRPIPFFEKDTIMFKNFERAAFYQKLTQLRARNMALRPDAAYQAITTNQPDQVIAFLRTHEKQKVLVVVNVTAKAVTCSLSGNTIAGNYTDLFSAAPVTFAANSTVTLEPWGYKVYELNN